MAAPPSTQTVPPLPLGWRLLEAWFRRRYGIEPVAGDPQSLLAFNLFTHGGADVPLRCGTVVRAGDCVMEIHLRREALLPLLRLENSARAGIEFIKLGNRDLPRLVRQMEEDPRLRPVKALHALTLFHRGVSRYGFEVLPVRESHLEWWFTRWQCALMARDRGTIAAFGGADERPVVRHVWASRETVIQRYGARRGP